MSETGQSGEDATATPTPRQQYVLSLLDERDRALTVDELADEVTAWEADRRHDPANAPDRADVREELHDIDLPRLDRRGRLEFNDDEGLVGPVALGGETFDVGDDAAAGPADAAGGAVRRAAALGLATLGVAAVAVAGALWMGGEATVALLSAATLLATVLLVWTRD